MSGAQRSLCCLVLIALCCSGCPKSRQEEAGPGPAPASPQSASLRVIMVTDAAGLGDKGFNDITWKGIVRAQEELGIDAGIIESRDASDYVRNLSTAASSAQVVVPVGLLSVEALKKVAPEYPGTFFVQIEGYVDQPNVACYNFKSEEAGYLAGIVAALKSRSGKVAMIEGMDIPPVEAYECGFKAGVQTVNAVGGKSVEVSVASVGNFTDATKAKSLADAFIAGGADVLFRAAGGAGVGVLASVKAHDGTYLIGEDLDIDAELPGRILTCTLKHIDTTVLEAVETITRGEFQSGQFLLGYREDGVGITDMQHSRDLFSPEDLALIDQAKRSLTEQSVNIPNTREALRNFSVDVDYFARTTP